MLEQTARIRSQEEQLRQTNRSIMEVLSAAIEFRNCDSGIHVRRVQQVTRLLLMDVVKHHPESGLTQAEVDLVSELSVMHDIGKIAVPDTILTKGGQLTPEEFEQVKAHTIYGGELVQHILLPQEGQVQRYFYEICRHHHERWDGRGYPDGLKGEQIPVWVQAVAVADVYEALVSRRVYKPAHAAGEAVRMILDGECGAFCPWVLESLRRVAGRLEAEVGDETAEERPAALPLSLRGEENPARQEEASETVAGSREQNSTRLLSQLEQEKYRLIAEFSEDMVFTYNAIFDSMEFSEKLCRVFRVPAYLKEYSHRRPSERVFYPEEFRTLREKQGRFELGGTGDGDGPASPPAGRDPALVPSDPPSSD